MKLSLEKIKSRFFNRVYPEPNTGCFFWVGGIDTKGYGQLKFRDGDLSMTAAHRISYYLAYGPFDYKLCVCHRCDNPTCVNPDHLFLGTVSDNVRDSIQKGRAHRGSRNARLTNDDILEIRAKYKTNKYTYSQLGDEYGISKHHACKIVLRKVWGKLQ